ncbi:MAG: hypothetical protein ACJA2F_000139 [Nitriliruptoraceae bacterium]|jgi:hypothetical protein
MIEGIVRQQAAKVAGVVLTAGPTPPGDPGAVTLNCQTPGALQVVVRVFPGGAAFLWVGANGSPYGPVELDERDAADLSNPARYMQAAGWMVIAISTTLTAELKKP